MATNSENSPGHESVVIDNDEGISVENLIEAKTTGCFDLLDEESKLPTPRAEHFTIEVHKRNKGHPRLEFPRKSKLRSSREIRDDEGFLIQHFTGGVVYTTAQFIEKNNDALDASLLILIQESGKLNIISVGSKFRSQLTDLMNKLRSTVSYYILKFWLIHH
ncbi:unnamed protein product [Rotaria sp. Silwood1]|nr:unnamed protein product [Rotaria sp. Silwood1]